MLDFIFLIVLSFLILITFFLLFIEIRLFILWLFRKKKSFSNMWQLDLVLLILYTIGTILIYKPAIVGLNISGSENYNNHKTIDLMSEGRFSDALGYSEKAYNDLKNKKNTSPILFLLYLYNNTQSVIDKNKSELYDATFNYAACLEENGIEVDKAAALFEKCIIEGPQFGLEKAIYIETSAYVLLKIYIIINTPI